MELLNYFNSKNELEQLNRKNKIKASFKPRAPGQHIATKEIETSIWSMKKDKRKKKKKTKEEEEKIFS